MRSRCFARTRSRIRTIARAAGIAASSFAAVPARGADDSHWIAAIEAAREALERRPLSAECTARARARGGDARGPRRGRRAFRTPSRSTRACSRPGITTAAVAPSRRDHERARRAVREGVRCESTRLPGVGAFRTVVPAARPARRRRGAPRSKRGRRRSVLCAGIPTMSARLSLGGCMLPRPRPQRRGPGLDRARRRARAGSSPTSTSMPPASTRARRNRSRARYLERVPMAPAGNRNWITHDPCLDPVRSHSRFTALLSAAPACSLGDVLPSRERPFESSGDSAGESSWTAAIMAATLSGSTPGWMPWPRLKTWPGPRP